MKNVWNNNELRLVHADDNDKNLDVEGSDLPDEILVKEESNAKVACSCAHARARPSRQLSYINYLSRII